MPQIQKRLNLPKLKYYETHLSILNCILPKKMTPKEIEILAHFMSLEGELTTYRFGPTGKKVVMRLSQISVAGLSNHLTSLLEKGFLVKNGDIIEFLPILIPEEKEQIYLLKLVNINIESNEYQQQEAIA